MPSNDLAAAVERLLSPTQPDEYWEPDYEYGEPDHHTAEKDLPMVAQACRAYLAREADDAKPITREWLVSVLGEPDDPTDAESECEDAPPTWMRTGDTYIELWRAGGAVGHRSKSSMAICDRGDVRAFLRLARWTANETGGE